MNESGLNLSGSGGMGGRGGGTVLMHFGEKLGLETRDRGMCLPQWCSVSPGGLQPVRLFVGEPTELHP